MALRGAYQTLLGELKTRLRDEGGGVIILVILVSMVVLGGGAMALTVSRTHMKVTANHNRGVLARYHSEGQLQRTVGMQNDLTSSPRWLFDASNYSYRASGPNDTSRMVLQAADAPFGGGVRGDGNVLVRIIGKDPVSQSPPYTIQSRSVLADGSSATYQAVVDVISLLDYAVFSDADVGIAPNITISGRMYSGGNIWLSGPNINFLQRVEYAGSMSNASYGTFFQGYSQVPPLPSIPSLVNLTFFENASKNAGVCSQGRGLYIGYDGPGSIDTQTTTLFRAYQGGSPAGYSGSSSTPGCRLGSSCFAVDMSLFDFSANPITYGGTTLLGYNGQPLANFNGVIFSDDEIHIWGHLGGRSPEENTITDTRSYITPPFLLANVYSNNLLDTNEDGSNGWPTDGQLQVSNKGLNLGIYGNEDIIIDHNLFAGTDSIGNPVRMALVARNFVYPDGYSPKLIRIESAVLATNDTWDPYGSHSDHRPNDWANLNGSLAPNSYVYDIDWDGTIESNNGMLRTEDRNETSMLDAWALQNLGNLIVATQPNSGHWASHGHPRFYTYDTQLQTAEIPCYPTLPNYGIVPGSFTQVLNAP